MKGEPEGWVDAVRHYIRLVEASDVRELRVATPTLRLGLRRSPADRMVRPPHRPATPARPSHLHQVRAPLTGIWYDAASPGASPYVDVGSLVDVGTVVGLVETMKIFNEITADACGEVVEVHVRRGDLVAAHTPLMSLDPREGARWLPPE